MRKYGYIVKIPPGGTKWKMKYSKTKIPMKNWIKFTKAYNPFVTLTLLTMKRFINVATVIASMTATGLLFYSVSHHEAFPFAAILLLISGALTVIPTK